MDLIYQISAYSILVPFIIACIKIDRLNTIYKPFLFFVFAGFTSELLCSIHIWLHRPFYIVLNIYFLVQAYYVTWQFKNWGLFKKYWKVYWVLQAFYSLAWLLEDVYFDFTKYILSYFVIASNFIMAIMSISIINKLVIKVHGSLWKNPVFLICFAWLVFFTFSVLAETFFKYGLQVPEFAGKIYRIVQLTNVVTNIIFGIAILWIPSKPKFILPSSSQA